MLLSMRGIRAILQELEVLWEWGLTLPLVDPNVSW
jgi:hypothetical protein